MRTREEIDHNIVTAIAKDNPDDAVRLIAEVLLDIRDLLTNKKSEV